MLFKNSVSGVALVGEDGRLVGNFSATDLKGLYEEKLPKLLQPADEYLEESNPQVIVNECNCSFSLLSLSLLSNVGLWFGANHVQYVGVLANAV